MHENQREEFTAAFLKAAQAAQMVAQVERFYKVVGGGIGLAVRVFALPWLATVAWNNMTTLPDWPYWPTVAAFLVVNVLIATIRGPSK